MFSLPPPASLFIISSLNSLSSPLKRLLLFSTLKWGQVSISPFRKETERFGSSSGFVSCFLFLLFCNTHHNIHSIACSQTSLCMEEFIIISVHRFNRMLKVKQDFSIKFTHCLTFFSGESIMHLKCTSFS